jgi:chemotaxis family two-component system sensor kinase Cph1
MDQAVDTTACDHEPIHIPGSIQPYGLMLVVERDGLVVRHVAGDVEGRLGVVDWQGRALDSVIGEPLAHAAADLLDQAGKGLTGQLDTPAGRLDVSLHVSGPWVIVELEPALEGEASAAAALVALESAATAFERTTTLATLCAQAARSFRLLTGFDRVMVYRFLDEEAGVVVGEDVGEGLQSFMNHHFPGSDIPRQARALYVRNLIRVIPQSDYQPAPLRPGWTGVAPLDMSDAGLRSVSPIHLQYLRNMGVAASASVSIVKDGVLWGLIACHNQTPRTISYETRIACRTLASSLARQIKAREEAEGYRERIRLRGFEDDILTTLSREGALDEALSEHIVEIGRMLGGDGVAVLRGKELVASGVRPTDGEIREMAAWIGAQGGDDPVFSTDRLGETYPLAQAYARMASGILAVTVSAEEPWLILWFRAEQVEEVEWAGNPHKSEVGPGGVLNPRASFDAWREEVHGRSRRWTLPEIEAAARLRTAVLTMRQNRRIRELNVRLTDTLADKTALLQQKEFLIGEVNHRVQNSLQLVSSFLALQTRDADDGFKVLVEEARRRVNAVALVHRRLYRGDHVGLVDAARYLQELIDETMQAMGSEWATGLTLDLEPVSLPTDRAVTVGLIITELMINANKYAYDGAAGPLTIRLAESRDRFRLTVADRGGGKAGTRKGFGSRLMDALVGQLDGELTYEDNEPGLRAVLTAPLEAKR